MTRALQGLAMLCLLAFAGSALAADQCPSLRGRQSDPEVATRIAAVACDEHMRWRRPFITSEGRLASSIVAEGEGSGLEGGGAARERMHRTRIAAVLALAAARSNVPLFMVRAGAEPEPSAALTRWRVRAALSAGLAWTPVSASPRRCTATRSW